MEDYEDTNVSNLIINNISQEKFEELKTAGQLEATQVYLTPEQGGGAGGDYLPLSGGTLTGQLQVEGISPSRFGSAPILTLVSKSNDGEIYGSYTLGATAEGFSFDGAVLLNVGSILPKTNNVSGLGNYGNGFKFVHTKKLYNGADLIVPTEGGTLARIEDINNIVEVLPTADNGYTTVKNFGNGYVEITGYASIGTVGAGTGSEVQIDLPAGYTMADANYWVNIAPTSETTMFDFKAEAKARSTTHFMVAYKNEDSATGLTAAGVYWEVRGILATA